MSDGELRAQGEVLTDNPSHPVAGTIAYDDRSNQVARGTGTCQGSDMQLTEAGG